MIQKFSGLHHGKSKRYCFLASSETGHEWISSGFSGFGAGSSCAKLAGVDRLTMEPTRSNPEPLPKRLRTFSFLHLLSLSSTVSATKRKLCAITIVNFKYEIISENDASYVWCLREDRASLQP